MKYALRIMSLVGSLICLSSPLYSRSLTLYGNVMDLKTNFSVSADITIFINSDFIRKSTQPIESGQFNIELDEYGWYLFTVTAPGYLEASDTLWILDDHRTSVNKDFYLTQIEVGLTVSLNHINFDFNQTNLTHGSFSELDHMANFFRSNPGIHFEIAGHTDSDGPAEYNLLLSQGRAQAVVKYLISQGVSRSQLKARGYGETQPIDTRNTNLAKARNRRVEFRVISTALIP